MLLFSHSTNSQFSLFNRTFSFSFLEYKLLLVTDKFSVLIYPLLILQIPSFHSLIPTRALPILTHCWHIPLPYQQIPTPFHCSTSHFLYFIHHSSTSPFFILTTNFLPPCLQISHSLPTNLLQTKHVNTLHTSFQWPLPLSHLESLLKVHLWNLCLVVNRGVMPVIRWRGTVVKTVVFRLLRVLAFCLSPVSVCLSISLTVRCLFVC